MVSMRKANPSDVLRHKHSKTRQQGTVKLAFYERRREKGIPERCDNRTCMFHTGPLIWDGKPLKPVLDHKNGYWRDNSESNLQLLCPNCNSQQHTHGGKNRGKIKNETEDGWTRQNDDGSVDVYATGRANRKSTVKGVGA